MIFVPSGLPEPLETLIHRHPQVQRGAATRSAALPFRVGEWQRGVQVGKPECEVYGLVELMDNNPMVCADEVSVPGPAATLALIGLGPLLRAGLVMDTPVIQLSFAGDDEDLNAGLRSMGADEEPIIQVATQEMETVRAAIIHVEVPSTDVPQEYDDLFDEAYGRSFFVHRHTAEEWHAAQVLGQPHAQYQLRWSPGDGPTGLLTILVMADIHGKLGAAQLVHAMNVMAGQEESLGIVS